MWVVYWTIGTLRDKFWRYTIAKCTQQWQTSIFPETAWWKVL